METAFDHDNLRLLTHILKRGEADDMSPAVIQEKWKEQFGLISKSTFRSRVSSMRKAIAKELRKKKGLFPLLSHLFLLFIVPCY